MQFRPKYNKKKLQNIACFGKFEKKKKGDLLITTNSIAAMGNARYIEQ